MIINKCVLYYKIFYFLIKLVFEEFYIGNYIVQAIRGFFFLPQPKLTRYLFDPTLKKYACLVTH